MVRDRLPDLLASQSNISTSNEEFQQAQNPLELQEVPDDNKSNSNTFDRESQQDEHPQATQDNELKQLLYDIECTHDRINFIQRVFSDMRCTHKLILQTYQAIARPRDCSFLPQLKGYFMNDIHHILEMAFCVQRNLKNMNINDTALDSTVQDVCTRVKIFQYINMSQRFYEIMVDYYDLLIQFPELLEDPALQRDFIYNDFIKSLRYLLRKQEKYLRQIQHGIMNWSPFANVNY